MKNHESKLAYSAICNAISKSGETELGLANIECLVKLIDWHHVHGNILSAIGNKPSEKELPIFQYCQQNLKANHLYAFKNTIELIKISNAFDQDEIRFLAFKGPTLSQQLYAKTEARYSKDIDILIHPDDIDRAEKLIRSLNYNRTKPKENTSQSELKLFRLHCKNSNFKSRVAGVEIELHWQLGDFHRQGNMDFDDLYEHREICTIQNHEIPVFSKSHLTCYLATHGVRSNWRRLKWLLDWHFHISQQQLDWREILKIAENYNMKVFLNNAAQTSNTILGTPIPNSLKPFSHPWFLLIYAKLVRKFNENCSFPSHRLYVLTNLLAIPSIIYHLNYVNYAARKITKHRKIRRMNKGVSKI